MAIQDTQEKKKFDNKVLNAACAFLINKGYTIISKSEKNKSFDIVAVVDDTLVFIDTKGYQGKSFREDYIPPKRRQAIEKAIINWLSDNDYCDMEIRYDILKLLIMDSKKKRALIRHHINALSAAELSW